MIKMFEDLQLFTKYLRYHRHFYLIYIWHYKTAYPWGRLQIGYFGTALVYVQISLRIYVDRSVRQASINTM